MLSSQSTSGPLSSLVQFWLQNLLPTGQQRADNVERSLLTHQSGLLKVTQHFLCSTETALTSSSCLCQTTPKFFFLVLNYYLHSTHTEQNHFKTHRTNKSPSHHVHSTMKSKTKVTIDNFSKHLISKGRGAGICLQNLEISPGSLQGSFLSHSFRGCFQLPGHKALAIYSHYLFSRLPG